MSWSLHCGTGRGRPYEGTSDFHRGRGRQAVEAGYGRMCQVQNPSLIACHETDGECGLQRGKAINQAGWGLHMPSYKVKHPEKIIRMKKIKIKNWGKGMQKILKSGCKVGIATSHNIKISKN